ncbi:MAG: SH3 domain-containing protein [Caldilineaceae bacterium]
MRTQTLLNPTVANQPDRFARAVVLACALVLVLLLAGCTAVSPVQAPGSALSPQQSYGGVVESVLDYAMPVLPTPEPTPEVQPQVIVNTGGARANVRSAPSLNGEIVGKADNGQSFNVVARSEDNAWWQISGNGVEGWISDSIVRLAGESEEVPVSADASAGPLFDGSLQAAWDIDWSCTSEEGRCTVPACDANVTAGVDRPGDGQFVPVAYQVAWSDECFSTDSWVFEVDPLTGRERTGEYADNFLYSYWAGANAGDISGVYPFGDDEGIVVACSGPDTVEIEEGDGWTSSYEGVTCHDRRTGMLVYMNYVKRWLFTGEFEGKQYERAFFGDTETLEQRLVDTSAELFLVEKK